MGRVGSALLRAPSSQLWGCKAALDRGPAMHSHCLPSLLALLLPACLQERLERRKVHEQLQVLRGNIRVCCRVRPSLRCPNNAALLLLISASNCLCLVFGRPMALDAGTSHFLIAPAAAPAPQAAAAARRQRPAASATPTLAHCASMPTSGGSRNLSSMQSSMGKPARWVASSACVSASTSGSSPVQH